MAKPKNERVDYYIEIARDLIDHYRDLRKMQLQTDKIARLDWSLPSGMDAEWIREVKTTAPNDAIRAAVQVLSGLEERIKIDPFTIPGDLGEFSRDIANQWEMALKWQMDKAVRRRAILRQDVVRSAVMYDEIVGQVVHLPTQIKAIKKLGGNPNRQEASLRYGDFVINLRNPKNVYTRYSDYMLESVLYITNKKINDLQLFWNNPELEAMIEKDEAPEDWIYCDWSSYDKHVIFAVPGLTLDSLVDPEKTDEAIMFMDEEWKYDFLPWACVVGGSQLEVEPHHSRFPLLYGVWKADQFVNTNIIGSLQISEAISEAARPKVKKSGIRPESVTSDHGEPAGEYLVPAGHDVEAMPQMGLDPALREAYDRFVFEMNQSTLPRVLINAEAGPEETFSGFNLRVQQAMASLTPYKFLSERWFEEAYRTMLNWGKVSKMGIKGYDENRFEYEIAAEDIDPRRIYLKVELQQDVPIDRQARVQTAIQISTNLKLPTRDVLEQLGETNPDEKIKQWTFEQFDMAYLQGVLQKISFDSANTIQQIVTQVQQQAQQEMAALAQQQAAQQQGGEGGETPPGVAPSEGGLPIDQTEPGATSPAQATGTDAAGNPVAG